MGSTKHPETSFNSGKTTLRYNREDTSVSPRRKPQTIHEDDVSVFALTTLHNNYIYTPKCSSILRSSVSLYFTFLSRKRQEINQRGIHVMCLSSLPDFNQTWILYTHFIQRPSHQILRKSVQWEPRCSRRTTDTKKPTVSFHIYFATASKETKRTDATARQSWSQVGMF